MNTVWLYVFCLFSLPVATHLRRFNNFKKAVKTDLSSSSALRQKLQKMITKPENKQQNSDKLPSQVRVKLIPLKIQDLVEKNEVLETTIRLQVTWRDNRLQWMPRNYSGTREVIIPGNSIWTPDIAILNSVSDIYHVVRDTRFEMKVEYNGRVWWHPTGIVKTYCKLHLKYFPFDKQNCKIVLESPTLDLRFMNLTLRSTKEPVDTVMYIGGETWDLISVSGKNVKNKVTSKTTFSRVEFGIHLQRSRVFHILNVILPAVFLSFVQVMFFLLPATHPQRVGSSTTTLLSVVVFQTVAASQLPKTSTDVPILAIYILIVTFISGLSVCTSIFMAKFVVYANNSNNKLPRCLHKIPKLTHLFSTITNRAKPRLNRQQTDESDLENGKKDDDIEQGSDADEYMFNTWADVSKVFDTFLTAMAMTIAITSPILLFIILPVLVDQTPT